MDERSLGIYCLKDKCFYYLETGTVYVANTIDRIKKALVKRDLIEFSEKSFINTEDHKIMSIKEAKLKELKMVPIYISKHIQNLTKNKAVENDKKRNWGKKDK